MTNETMTIHEALAQLKMIDKRIADQIENTSFCVANKHSNKKIMGKSVPDFEKEVRSRYQSIGDMIRRRAAIRNALSRSNANTRIIVAGKEYTIAEAIEMKKTGITNQKKLLDNMRYMFTSANAEVVRNNNRLNDLAEESLQKMFGGKDKMADIEELNKMRETYIEQNTYEIVDPIGISGEIDRLDSEIESFYAEVDSKISISNAVTSISIEY